ncbi:MAG: ATP-binding protein [Planctomycetota bacterium]|jgi:SpoVK/Ycf46/Vps4 family AAA+-type ATPase
MPIDLTNDIRRSLLKTLSHARERYQAGDDDKAGKAYELASQLSLKLAERAPDRGAELKHKKDALRFREVAKRLEAGEAPPTNERGDGAANGKDGASEGLEGSGKSPLKGAVSSLITTSSITWAQIGGLDEVKHEIKYALALSIAKPPEGVSITSFRNMLFYGPPGTGKTLLAAATSNALRHNARSDRRAVFFNVKVSSLMSKYFGESTKLVSELYGQARDMAPAVVFLDEFEALAGSRDRDDSGTERRILSTVLSELDGLAEKGRKDIFVLTIAATNRPWDLDPAVLSRFDKKILIPLPGRETREAILKIHFDKKGFVTDVPLEALVNLTEGYSGREIERFAKEVQNTMIAGENEGLPALVDKGLDALRNYEIKVRSLDLDDFHRAASRITPQTSPQEMERYVGWQEKMSV